MKGGQYKLNVVYESTERFTARCWTILYSFGKSVLDKKQVVEPTVIREGSYQYNFTHSPICPLIEVMMDEVQHLKDDDSKNKVLQVMRFLCTTLINNYAQVLYDVSHNIMLMCNAFRFYVSSNDQFTVFKVK